MKQDTLKLYADSVEQIGFSATAKKFDIKEETLARYLRAYNADPDLVAANILYKKQAQKYSDINRIERKAFRQQARLDNVLLEANAQLLQALKDYPIQVKTMKHTFDPKGISLIVQLSDTHFNELVDLPHNKYDFQIAAKRLYKFAQRIYEYQKIGGHINNILVAMTGDLLNSDRRLDEMLNQATNRNNATYLAFLLLSQFIIDLNKLGKVTVAAVSGNESRVKEEKGYSDIIATDNYDFTIFNMLRVKLEPHGIKFVQGDPLELVVNIGGLHVLLLHGEGLETDTQKKIQQIIGKYALRQVHIDLVLYGHVHSPYLTDYSSRSGSLVGSNDYNEKALFLVSKASQNLHIIYPDKSFDSIKVDLQTTDNEGYEIIPDLEAYNAKSLKKALHHTTVITIE